MNNDILGGGLSLQDLYKSNSQGNQNILGSDLSLESLLGDNTNYFDRLKDLGNQSEGFGFNNTTFNGIGTGLKGLGQLAALYYGSKQLKQAKNQFATQTAFANRNLANQSTLINSSLAAKAKAAQAQHTGSSEGAQYVQVDGSAIK